MEPPVTLCFSWRGVCRVKSVARFGKRPRVLFIAEDAEALAYMKKRWPSQTVSREDLHLEKEAADSSSSLAHADDRRHENAPDSDLNRGAANLC